MQEERKEQVEDSEEVEAHKRVNAPEEPGMRSRADEDDDEVEAHRAHRGAPEEFGKRIS